MAGKNGTAVAERPQQNGTAAPAATLENVVHFKPFMGTDEIKLSVNMVLNFLCTPTKSGQKCTPEQAMKFIMLCKARQLNPWEGDAYIVGFDSQNGPQFSLITAHQAFLKRAEAHPQYDGMESGIVVQRGTEILELPGDLLFDGDKLVGGWAKVYRKDRSHPTYRRLKLSTFSTGRSRWEKDPAGMIVKCAEADAQRSTFPNNLAGMYVEGEMDGTHGGHDKPASAATRVADLKGANVPAAVESRATTVHVATKEAEPTAAASAGDPDSDPFATGEAQAAGTMFDDPRDNLR